MDDNDRLGPQRPHLAWPLIIQLAQSALADALARAIADQRLSRQHYRRWLEMESALGRIGAQVLDRLGDWHGVQPPLRATALEWATSLREDALAAAADARTLDGPAPRPPPQLAQWHAYADGTCHSPRAGEALGTVLLHDRLFGGPAHDAAQRVLELPFLAASGRSWLQRRCHLAPSRIGREREALVEAWSATALAAGAQRAAGWHRAALESCFHSQTAFVH